ncbi:hypothetical protein Tco_1167372 [Tanacetum coccineum]
MMSSGGKEGWFDIDHPVGTPNVNSSSGHLSVKDAGTLVDEVFKLSRHGMEHGLELRQKKEKRTKVIYGMCSIIPKPRRR